MSKLDRPLVDGSEATFEELVAFLRGVGAAEVDHTTDADLLHHLSGTHDILAAWGCPQYLCRAGLFHSVYGTEFFSETTIPLTDRDRVRAVVGEDAERIAFLWGIVVRDSIYEKKDFIVSRVDGSHIPVTRQDVADLWTLDLANLLEFSSRVEPSVDNRRKSRELYERGLEFLPPAGVAAMRRAFADRA